MARENAAITFYSHEFNIRNIVPVLATIVDPLFPVNDLDMIIAYKSFHDFEKKDEWLVNVKKYLKHTGKLVIIDSYSEHSQLTFHNLKRMIEKAGFKFVCRKTRYFYIHIFELQKLG